MTASDAMLVVLGLFGLVVLACFMFGLSYAINKLTRGPVEKAIRDRLTRSGTDFELIQDDLTVSGPGWDGPDGFCVRHGWTPATPEIHRIASSARIRGTPIATDADGNIYYLARLTYLNPELHLRMRRINGEDIEISRDLRQFFSPPQA